VKKHFGYQPSICSIHAIKHPFLKQISGQVDWCPAPLVNGNPNLSIQRTSKKNSKMEKSNDVASLKQELKIR